MWGNRSIHGRIEIANVREIVDGSFS